MEKQLRILILEDTVDDVDLIQHQLKKGTFSFTSKIVETSDDYERALIEYKPDLVLSDHSLPMFDSILALKMFHSFREKYNSAAAFILVTGTVSEEFAVRIMKEGADDYILKDRLKRLPVAVENAVEKNRLKDLRRKEEEEKLYLFDILQRSLHEIYVIDPATLKFEYANEEALNNLGYTIEEMIKMTPAETIRNFDLPGFRNAVNHTERSTKGLIFERIAVRKDKSTYPIQIHLQVIRQGNKKNVLANVLDITEAKELEQQKELALFIQNSFSHNKNLKESLEIILKKICESCKCVAAEVYARELDQSGAKCLSFFNSYSNVSSASGKYFAEKVFHSGKIETSNNPVSWKSEDAEWLKEASINHTIAIPITLGNELIAVLVGYHTEDSNVNRKFSVFSDQVQQKLAGNIKRKRTEEELQKIFECSPDIVMVVGKDGNIRKVNSALQNILGYSHEEMSRYSVDNLIHPNDKPVVEKWRGDILEENEVAKYESRWLAKNGEYKWFSWSVTNYEKGELDIVVGRDVTDSKLQMKAIQKQNAKLSAIAWEQSHVVRGPLTRLLACVEYLEENKDNSKDILSSVKRSAYEIDNIIKDIIKKSKKVELNG